MKNPELVAAILGAGGLIGLGLFLGLRAQAPAMQPSVALPASASPASSAAVGAARQPTAEPVATTRPVAGVDVKAALQAEIERRRPELVKACWAPAAAKAPEPRSSTQTWNGTIGPEGTPLAFSLIELRGKSRPEVVSCLQDRLSSLRLTPAPGQSSYVEVTFTLP